MVALYLFIPLLSLVSPDIITLPKNAIHLDETIDNELISYSISKLYSINETEDIYMYINSNGGSVHAGNKLIEQMSYMKSKNRTIHCVGQKMISMAFAIFQHCTHRYSLSTSIAMQHQMSLSAEGQIANLNSYLDLANNMYADLVKYQAKRLKMKVSDFNTKIKSDWWVYGQDIVDYGVSDKRVIAGCQSFLFCPFF